MGEVGLLMRKEEERIENSDLRVGSWSSDLSWSCAASKKMRKEKGRGRGREMMRFRSWSLRRMTPLGEVDWRCWRSERRSEEVVRERVRRRERRKVEVRGDIVLGILRSE